MALPASAGADHAGPLAGQWHLDASQNLGDGYVSTADSSGHDLEVIGDGLLVDGGGKFGNALSASDEGYIRREQTPLLQPQRLTVMAWVQHNGYPGELSYIVGQGHDGGTCNGPSYAIYSGTSASQGLHFFIRTTADAASFVFSPAAGSGVWDGQWHLVAGVYDGERVRLYVDGNEVGSGTPSPAASINYGLVNSSFWFGSYPPVCASSGEFAGRTDEVRVYRRGLSGTELARLAAAPGPDAPELVPDAEPGDPGGPGEGPGGGPGEGPVGGGTAPPAPVVTAVEPEEPLEAGRAAVLNARVDGQVDSIHWNLFGDSKPEIVSAPGSTGVRFRPRPGTFIVEARAVGPGGAGPVLSQAITGPPALEGISPAVSQLLTRTPPVVATGRPGALGGKIRPETQSDFLNTCLFGGTTVRAGPLEITAGCIEPITSVDQIAAAERGILDELGKQLGLPDLSTAQANGALRFTDAFTIRGAATVNGATLRPEGSATIVIFPQINAVVSANARLSLGDLKLAARANFKLDTRFVGGRLPLGSFPRLPGLPSLGAFNMVGDVDVSLAPADGVIPSEALVTVRLKLPSFLKVGGVDFQGEVKMRANAREGLIVDNLTIGPINAKLGALDVTAFQLAYTRAGAEWRGQGKACVVKTACLDMVPPNGGVVVRNGELAFAGATLGFPPPGIILYPGVALDRIGFSMGLNPTRFGGNARINLAQVLAIDGRLLLAFPSESTPFVFDRAEVGNEYPPAFYGRRHTRPTVAVSATAFLKVPKIGEVRLGGAYVLYEYPGYLAFGGGVSQSFVGVLSISGGVTGELNFDNGRFNILGQVRACIVDVLCSGGFALVSSRGLSACIDIGPLSVGGGVRYDPFWIKIWPIDGCRWSPFAEQNVRDGRAVAAQAGSPHVVEIAQGDPSRVIQLDGVDAAPRVRVTGPGGVSLESSPGSGMVDSGPVRIIRSEPAKATAVGLQDPPPGTYRIEPLEGSSAVAKVNEAEDQPKAEVEASVEADGERYVLTYDILRRAAQRVTFSEIGEDGSARAIGTVEGGGRGRLAFTPAPGTGFRRVEAQFELDGLPAEKLTVARFSPPSPVLGAVRRLRVRRRGSSLAVSWRRVPGATRYEVVTTPTGGAVRMVTTRRTRTTVTRVPRTSSGRVSVRAVTELRAGRPASAAFRRTAARPSRFRPLPTCTAAARVVCRAG